MTSESLMAADNHLSSCAACCARIDRARNSDTLGIASRAFEQITTDELAHLSFEQIASLTDGLLDEIESEIAQSHLAICAQCKSEFNELRTMTREPAGNSSPEKPIESRPTLLERLRVLWERSAFHIPIAATGTVALILLVSILVTIPIRTQNAELRKKLADLERSNEILKQKFAESDELRSEITALHVENEDLRKRTTTERPLIALNDGGRVIGLDGDGRITGVALEARYERSLRDALQNERVRLPDDVKTLRGQLGKMMGDVSDAFKLTSPVGVVVQSDQPLFRWSPINGNARYTVTIYDSNKNIVANSEPLAVNQWTAPQPLARGGTYIWQVRAVVDQKETVAPAAGKPRVRFKVLDQSSLDEIQHAKKSSAGSHLVIGLVYAQAGLLEDAELELGQVQKANPQSEVARRLLASVQNPKR